MNNNNFRTALAAITCLLFIVACNTTANETTPAQNATAASLPAATMDVATLKADIQGLESAWAQADNARDANAVAAYYADDAITMSNFKPMIVGKPAILKDIEASLAKKPKGATVAYDVVDVYPGENTATEVGKITVKDTTGKVTYTGKYMAVWEKRNGKYVCIRDISNDDAKEK